MIPAVLTLSTVSKPNSNTVLTLSTVSKLNSNSNIFIPTSWTISLLIGFWCAPNCHICWFELWMLSNLYRKFFNEVCSVCSHLKDRLTSNHWELEICAVCRSSRFELVAVRCIKWNWDLEFSKQAWLWNLENVQCGSGICTDFLTLMQRNIEPEGRC
jgi:hypothetical protein